MPPYTARTGGIFGSGLYPNSRPQIDVGGAIDAVTRGATSLIGQAYQRRLADQQRQIAEQERTRQHSREDVLDARAAEQFQMEKDKYAATMAASGYTPAHTETTTAVEPGAVDASGGLLGKNKITGPSLKTSATTIPGAYDYRKSQTYQIANDTRTRKTIDFAKAYKIAHPDASEDEALEYGLYAADNPSIADNMLYPRPDQTSVHATNRNYDIKHPTANQRSGSANSPIGKALTTVNSQIDDNARDRSQLQSRMRSRFGTGPTMPNLDDAKTAADTADFRRMQSEDSTYEVNGRTLAGRREGLAARQLRESGLQSATADSTSTAKKPAAAKPTITKAEAKALRDKGFTDKQINQKYTIQ